MTDLFAGNGILSQLAVGMAVVGFGSIVIKAIGPLPTRTRSARRALLVRVTSLIVGLATVNGGIALLSGKIASHGYHASAGGQAGNQVDIRLAREATVGRDFIAGAIVALGFLIILAVISADIEARWPPVRILRLDRRTVTKSKAVLEIGVTGKTERHVTP